MTQTIIPEGSTGKQARSGGTCTVCGREDVPRSRMVLRALFFDWDEEKETGHKVCSFCSPHVADETVERFNTDYEDWDYRWRQHLDSDVYTKGGEVVRSV